MSNTKNTSQSQNSQEPDGEERAAPRRTARGPLRPLEVLRQARTQLAELTGMTAETVSSFEQTEDGWSLEVEVLELARVPDTMSLMASYLVTLDRHGQLTGYRRARRYERGRSEARRSGGS